MTSSTDPEFEYQLQLLAQAGIVPAHRFATADEIRLTAAKRTVDQNYFELDEYIDGDLRSNPMFFCHSGSVHEQGFEVLRLLHNYLASLYSLNETIRVLCNQYTTDGTTLSSSDFTPASGGTEQVYYGRKLSFLRGLRTDFQHGGFSCFTFDKVGSLGEFEAHHVTFDRSAFIEDSGLREPSRFLQWTNQAEQRHPISYVGTFHQQTLQHFYEDVNEWFSAL